MKHQIPLNPQGRADRARDDAFLQNGTREVAADLAIRRLAIESVAFFGPPGARDRAWVLIDAGVKETT